MPKRGPSSFLAPPAAFQVHVWNSSNCLCLAKVPSPWRVAADFLLAQPAAFHVAIAIELLLGASWCPPSSCLVPLELFVPCKRTFTMARCSRFLFFGASCCLPRSDCNRAHSWRLQLPFRYLFDTPRTGCTLQQNLVCKSVPQ